MKAINVLFELGWRLEGLAALAAFEI